MKKFISSHLTVIKDVSFLYSQKKPKQNQFPMFTPNTLVENSAHLWQKGKEKHNPEMYKQSLGNWWYMNKFTCLFVSLMGLMIMIMIIYVCTIFSFTIPKRISVMLSLEYECRMPNELLIHLWLNQVDQVHQVQLCDSFYYTSWMLHLILIPSGTLFCAQFRVICLRLQWWVEKDPETGIPLPHLNLLHIHWDFS